MNIKNMNSQNVWKVAICAVFHVRHHKPITTFSTPYCIVDECQKCGCQHVSYTIDTSASVERKLRKVLERV